MIKRALIFTTIFVLVIIIAMFFVFDSFTVRDIAKRFIVTQSRYQLGVNVDVDEVRFSYFRPSITFTNIVFEKTDGDVKVKLSAPKARVSFKLLKLIRGQVNLKGFSLDSPKFELEFEHDDTQKGVFDYKELYDRFIATKISNIEIKNANAWVKANYKSGKKTTETSFTGLNFRISEGILSDYNVSASTADLKIPIRQLHSFDLTAYIKKNDLKVEKLKLKADGGDLSLDGSVHGINDLKEMSIDLFWKMNFSLASMVEYDPYLKDKDLYEFKGDFFGQGRVKFVPEKGLDSLSGYASTRLNKFLWGRFDIPKAEAIVSYDKNKVQISKADLFDGTKSVSLYDTSIGLTAPYPIKGQGLVNDVELSHYLEMFGIKHCLSLFNIKGPFNFKGNVKPSIKISSMLDLKVDNFWVLYKKGLKPSEDNSILSFKNGSIKGAMNFSSKGAYFDKLVAQSEQNTMVVNGWIYADSTMDLDVNSSAFSVNTYGRVGDVPLKGNGILDAKLIVDQNGDFKANGSLKFSQVEMLNKYGLGEVNSNVTYDGDKLSFKEVKGKVGGTHYSGFIDILFKENKTLISGRGDFRDAYTEDVYKLFNYTKKILGSPSGFASGSVKFDGYPAWSTIKLDAKLKMRDVEFFSERFDELVTSFVWNKGDVQINDLYLVKGKGRFDFKGGRKDGLFKLEVSSKNVSASDLTIASKQGVYLGGNVDLKGNVENKNDKFSGLLKLNIVDLLMGEKKLKPLLFNLEIGESITLKFKLFEKEVDGELKRENDGIYSLKAKLKDFNFYPVASIFTPEIDEFKTTIDGDVSFRFSPDGGIKSAVVNLSSFGLNGAAFNISSHGNVYVEYAGGSYSIRPFVLVSDSEATKCSMSVSNEGKKISIKGCVSAAVLKLFKNFVSSSRGKIETDLYMDSRLNGTVYLRDFELTSAEHKLGALSVNGRIGIINNVANLDSLNVLASGGTVTLSGGLDITNLVNLKSLYPSAKLKANIDKLYFEYPEGLKGKWSGNLEMKGSARPYNLGGDLILYDASYRKDFDLNSFNFSDDQRVTYGKKAKPFFNLNVKAKTSSEIYIKNSIFKGDLIFDLNAKGSELEPKIIGSIDLLRGNINYMDNDFELTSGRVRFKDDENEPYVYQLDSEIKTTNYQVYLKVISRNGEPKFKLTSVPPLTEDKIMALLATGDTQTDFTERQGGYGATAGAGGQAITEGMGVTGVLKNTTGVGVKLKAPKTKDSTAPDVELQKDLTNDIRVTYGKSLDEKSTNKQEVNVQYDVNRNVQLKLLLQEDTKNDVNKVPTNNAGVDVKFKFEF